MENLEIMGFWQRKKVLVTGHTGFKGSWLSLWLQWLGSTVIGYALPPPTSPNLFEVARVAEGMTSDTGDVRDLERLQKAIAFHKPEIIFHLAAQPLVRYSYKNPIETYTTNVIGTVNLLEAVRMAGGCRVVVCITSDKCYANQEWFWPYREDERLGGRDPYSSSKACAELAITAYRHSYFSPGNYHKHTTALASVRAGNVIGGGDWSKDRLIPDLVAAVMEQRPVIIRNPDAVRPWQHVLAPLDGYLMLAERLWSEPQFAQSWNFGPHDEEAKPVSWIVEYMTRTWGHKAGWKLDRLENPHEDIYLKLDCSKAKALLGWQPKLSLSTSLEWIVEWYQAYRDAQAMRRFTEAQISHYEDRSAQYVSNTNGDRLNEMVQT